MKFKFSIVTAVYNVEQFLADAIESVIKQDIGFKDNVQLILVDDGSKDSSGKICDAYAAKYPNNILVIHKENGGVSSARNEGLKHIQGKYVNFLDSDDKLSKNTLSSVYKFFENNYESVDLVSIPIKFFDGRSGEHILNYKYIKGSRVIDLQQEYDCIQLQIASSFIKFSDAKNMQFDYRLSYAEDANEVIKVLAKKEALGVCCETSYNYRKRSNGEKSLLQNSLSNKAWYMPSLKYFTENTLKKMQETYEKIPKFVQYTLMYDLQWRFKTSLKDIRRVLKDDEVKEFKDKIFSFLNYFDDDIILQQRNSSMELKTFLLSKKYNKKAYIVNNMDNQRYVYVNDTRVAMLKDYAIRLEFLTLAKDKIKIEFTYSYINGLQGLNHKLFLGTPSGNVLCESTGRVLEEVCFDELVATLITYVGIADIHEVSQLKILEYIDGVLYERNNLVSGKFFPVVDEFKNNYVAIGNLFVTLKNGAINIEKCSIMKKIAAEFKLLNEYSTLNIPAAKKAIVSRIAYHILKPFFRKEMWLISDRINKADDNGEAFFKYINENKLPVNSYFVIRKDSADYPIVAKIGKVLDYSTLKHKFFHLLADKTVSSAADNFVYYPFGSSEKFYRDILWRKKHIFLQHGITKDDLSGWLNRYNKNLSMIVTSAEMEYKSIKNGEYYYDDSVVKLTGLPRFDRLVNNSKRIITIMPTWRSYFVNNDSSAIDGLKKYNEDFNTTAYFNFYNDLLNDERLLNRADSLGYKIRFMPHPNVINYIDWFDRNDYVEFLNISTKYRDIFSTSGLVVTDYSSIAFDFAYLRKPVVYAQFDKEEFFAGHTYDQGYFDYERDGFGEVEYNLKSTIDRIIEYMESGCELKDKYRERIDKFFAFNDKNNCLRIYENICKI
ncbi:MAG: CDP-glycerol glycerophosphotransferase family protein [Phascolarctobacterium sp.]|nr:CDP-glycerol glycerophosphotransferase family protein [Phascolarctobacterium sp.]